MILIINFSLFLINFILVCAIICVSICLAITQRKKSTKILDESILVIEPTVYKIINYKFDHDLIPHYQEKDKFYIYIRSNWHEIDNQKTLNTILQKDTF
jgi:hypothetical protein